MVSDPADSHLQEDSDNIVHWSDDNHRKINGKKSKEIVNSFKKVPPFIPSLKINSLDIDRVTISTLLRIYVSTDLKCGPYVGNIHAKALKRLYFHSIYIIAPHLQYKEAITKSNLPTIKDCLEEVIDFNGAPSIDL